MKLKRKEKEPSALENAIDDLLFEMKKYDGESTEYAKMVTQLVKLYELKEIDKKEPVKLDTLVIVGGNLAAVIIVVLFESNHIMTTKAWQFLVKAR